MTGKGRVALGVLGLVVVLVGLLTWSLESEYGSGLNFSMSNTAGGEWVVSEIDEHAGTSEVVFTGSQEEASAYTDQRRSDGVSLLLPGLMIGAGALMVVIAGLWPALLRLRRRDGAGG